MGRTFVNVPALRRVQGLLGAKGRVAQSLRRTKLTIGIHEEEGQQLDDGGATVAAIAAFQEFGTSTIPRRSWLLDGLAENEAAINNAWRRFVRAALKGTIDVDSGWRQFGEFVVLRLQTRIRGSIPPPNTPATVALKGSSTTLIDEGRLLASIRAKIQG